MVKTYCVKEKIFTDCVPGSGRYVREKNGKLMYKCTCSNCEIIKCNFVKEAPRGEGLGDVLLHAGLKSIWELGKAGVT